jgi:hypothetical protein
MNVKVAMSACPGSPAGPVFAIDGAQCTGAVYDEPILDELLVGKIGRFNDEEHVGRLGHMIFKRGFNP